MPPKGMCYNCLNSDVRAAVDYMAATAMNGSNQDGCSLYKSNAINTG